MAEKSPRRRMMEESLASDPADTFLRYGTRRAAPSGGEHLPGQRHLVVLDRLARGVRPPVGPTMMGVPSRRSGG